MVVRERVMRVTSKHSSSRRGFFLIPVLVRLVGKSVERVEPHDLWIRTALHRSTYRHRHRAPHRRLSTISRCYQTRATPNYFHFTTTLPTVLPGVSCKRPLLYNSRQPILKRIADIELSNSS